MDNSRTKIAIGTVAIVLGLNILFCAIGTDADNDSVSAKAEADTGINIIYEPMCTVPTGDTSFKSYMDFRAITNVSSEQYKLQEECVTDSHGLRKYGDDYVIAVGSYYADRVGDRLEITLESGEKFMAVVGDFKADAHTDKTNRYYPMSDGKKNVIEFIVDTDALDSMARKMGDISYIDGFEGNIDSIEKE